MITAPQGEETVASFSSLDYVYGIFVALEEETVAGTATRKTNTSFLHIFSLDLC